MKIQAGLSQVLVHPGPGARLRSAKTWYPQDYPGGFIIRIILSIIRLLIIRASIPCVKIRAICAPVSLCKSMGIASHDHVWFMAWHTSTSDPGVSVMQQRPFRAVVRLFSQVLKGVNQDDKWHVKRYIRKRYPRFKQRESHDSIVVKCWRNVGTCNSGHVHGDWLWCTVARPSEGNFHGATNYVAQLGWYTRCCIDTIDISWNRAENIPHSYCGGSSDRWIVFPLQSLVQYELSLPSKH